MSVLFSEVFCVLSVSILPDSGHRYSAVPQGAPRAGQALAELSCRQIATKESSSRIWKDQAASNSHPLSHQYALQREMVLMRCVGMAFSAGEAEAEEVPPAPSSTADACMHILAQEFAHAQGGGRL